jgi:hypothetical protein
VGRGGGNTGKMWAEAAAIIVAAPQALGGFGEQVLCEMVRALFAAHVRFKDVLMADAFGKAGGGRLDIHAMQHLVEQHAVDAAPHPAQLKRRRVPQLSDGQDAGAVQALLHTRADAVDVLQFEAEQNVGQLVMGDDDKSVRLLQVGTDLAEEDVRREADRAGEAFADLLAQRAFDLRI